MGREVIARVTAGADYDIDAAVLQVQGMGAALISVSEDRDAAITQGVDGDLYRSTQYVERWSGHGQGGESTMWPTCT